MLMDETFNPSARNSSTVPPTVFLYVEEGPSHLAATWV